MSDAHYLSARLRALKGRLLSPREYGRLLVLPDLPTIVSALRGTACGRAIDAAGGAAGGVAAVEEGLRRHVAETLAGLLAVSAGECAGAVRLLLGYWEVRAIKTILRGKGAGLPAEEILSALCPSGLHDEAALREMCRQPDLRAVVHLLVAWREPWGRPLARALKEYRDPRDLVLLEAALDRFFFEREAGLRDGTALRSLPGVGDGGALSAFLALSADRANLMAALMLAEDRLVLADPGRHFVRGGWIYDERDFARLVAAPSLPEALGLAARSVFERPLKELPAPTGELPRLVEVERALDRALFRSAKRFLRIDPLGPGLLVGVVLGKLLEAVNLRTIARGRTAELPDAAIKGLLILDVS